MYYKPRLAWLVVVTSMTLVAACTTPAPQVIEVTRLVPQTVIVTQVVMLTETPPASHTPEITATPSLVQPRPTLPTFALPQGFDPLAYLPPKPLAGEGAVTFMACPNPDGLEDMAGFPIESAIELINNLRSGDIKLMQEATDPALWPLLGQSRPNSTPVTKDWFDGIIRPASESPYADMLTAQCGEAVARYSWWAVVCPDVCKQNSSEALKSHYFFVARHLLLLWLYL